MAKRLNTDSKLLNSVQQYPKGWGCGQATTEYNAPPQTERDVVRGTMGGNLYWVERGDLAETVESVRRVGISPGESAAPQQSAAPQPFPQHLPHSQPKTEANDPGFS